MRGGELPGALDPHLAAGVDEDLVDVAVGHQRVEAVEPGEAGHGCGDEPGLVRLVGKWRDRAHVAAHHSVDIARDLGNAPAEGVDQLVIGHWCTMSAVASDEAPATACVAGNAVMVMRVPSSRWIRPEAGCKSPASTARATAGSSARVATTGASMAVRLVARSALPGSTTSTRRTAAPRD